MDITIKTLSQKELENLGVFDWPLWEKEVSSFPWEYSDTESCYILQGEVTVTPKDGQPVNIKPGDFVVFPAGMQCQWDIKTPIRKHYSFG